MISNRLIMTAKELSQHLLLFLFPQFSIEVTQNTTTAPAEIETLLCQLRILKNNKEER
jgi:hypothetical protein